jgi:hypothetical protein
VAYVTSIYIWISWTSPYWELLIVMLSKSRKNSSKVNNESLGMEICHNKGMVNAIITHKTKDRVRRSNLKKTSPSHRKIRVMGSQIRTLKSGTSSKKFPNTTSMNVARNSHSWLSSKKKNQALD